MLHALIFLITISGCGWLWNPCANRILILFCFNRHSLSHFARSVPYIVDSLKEEFFFIYLCLLEDGFSVRYKNFESMLNRGKDVLNVGIISCLKGWLKTEESRNAVLQLLSKLIFCFLKRITWFSCSVTREHLPNIPEEYLRVLFNAKSLQKCPPHHVFFPLPFFFFLITLFTCIFGTISYFIEVCISVNYWKNNMWKRCEVCGLLLTLQHSVSTSSPFCSDQ